MTIEALSTEYQGKKFRSRTEARWAVFFQTLGLAWQHEQEGFDVEGTWYLPDFYLADFPMFIEVKPDQTDGTERAKFAAMCKHKATRGIIAYGAPNIRRANLLAYDANGVLEHGDELAQWLADRRNEGEYWLGITDKAWWSIGPKTGPDHDRLPIMNPHLEAAYRAAQNETFGVD